MHDSCDSPGFMRLMYSKQQGSFGDKKRAEISDTQKKQLESLRDYVVGEPKAEDSENFLFKSKLLVVQTLAIQLLQSGLAHATEEALTTTADWEEIAQRFTSLFHRQVPRGRLS
jgi:hypothetical protein